MVVYKADFNSKIKEIPWCFQIDVEVQNTVAWIWTAQHSSWPKKMQYIELKWTKGIISNNVTQYTKLLYICFTCFHCPNRDIYLQPMCYFRNKQCFEEIILAQRSTVFLTKHPLQPGKLLSFTSWWLLLSQLMFFAGKILLWRLDSF